MYEATKTINGLFLHPPMITDKRRRRRKALVRRFGDVCLRCGENKGSLTLDHVVPRSLGGNNSLHNLQLLCSECNEEKGNRIEDYRHAWSQRS